MQEVRFLDEAFAAKYETERRVGTVMKWMSAIALVISCMGLVGLAALAAARRTREIGIRKVLGATTGSVLMMMSREFGWLVVAANAIAWPVAFFVLDRWLAFYAYRIDQSPEWFALASTGVLAVALATVSGQTWLAARTKPGGCLEVRVVGRVAAGHLAKVPERKPGQSRVPEGNRCAKSRPRPRMHGPRRKEPSCWATT
ncbi:MAG: cell division protein FtsX [Gemmatimonadetes bacterium]|nr:cell division protein FtsX [Gemmatimonadota bacterium]